ncbi:MAG: hypothetical protein ACPGU9_01810 [Flavobacteriaceae bacterium]
MKYIIVIVSLMSSVVYGQHFHTEYTYDEILIQNSYPKGGLNYTHTDGNTYVYAVFWTQITNTSDDEVNLSISFNNKPFTIPNNPDNLFRVYLPKIDMNRKKDDLYNYGLDVKSFLHTHIDKSSELEMTLASNESHVFYTLVISTKAIKGTIRAGYQLHHNKLTYAINTHSMSCGKLMGKHKN